MATTAYQKKLLDPRWQKKRLKILDRDNWSCTNCGSADRTLHVHHTNYKGDPWDIEDDDLKTLCYLCHEGEHTETKVVNKHSSFDSFYKVIVITGNELLNIPHEDLGYKSSNNPHGIYAYLQYTYGHYVTYLNTSKEDFNTQFKNVNFTLKEYIQLIRNHLERDCVKSNVFLKTDQGNFGSQDNLLYQGNILPLSIYNVLKKLEVLENMTEEDYRKLYKSSKMNRCECIQDLFNGLNKKSKVLEIKFTYNQKTYGV